MRAWHETDGVLVRGYLAIGERAADAVLVGWSRGGRNIVLPLDRILHSPPDFIGDRYVYGDDGRRSLLWMARRVGDQQCASGIAICDHDRCQGQNLECVDYPIESLYDLLMRSRHRLIALGVDITQAHWLAGPLDDDGDPPDPYLHECLFAVEGETDPIIRTAWHPELRRLALERRLGRRVRVTVDYCRHFIGVGAALAARVAGL